MPGLIIGAIFGAIIGGTIGGDAAWVVIGAVLGAFFGLGSWAQEQEKQQHNQDVADILKELKDKENS